MTPTAARRALQLFLEFARPKAAASLGDVADRWRREYLLVEKLSPRTREYRELALRRLDRYGDLPVDGEWRAIACEIYATYRPTAASLVVNTLALLLRWAQARGLRLDEPGLGGLDQVRAQRRTAILNAEHRAPLLAALELETRPRRRMAADVVRLIVWTGMRVSEACSIEWDHVARRERFLLLPRTKNKKPRRVSLVDESLAVIDRQSRASRWVFPARDGDGPINRRQPEQVMTDACRVARIPHAFPHLLRHTWATVALQCNVPDRLAADMLGHTTRELARYQHPTIEDAARAMHVVAQKLGGAA